MTTVSSGSEDSLTREQMATIIWGYAQFKGYDVIGTADLNIFKDTGEMFAYALPAISAWTKAPTSFECSKVNGQKQNGKVAVTSDTRSSASAYRTCIALT